MLTHWVGQTWREIHQQNPDLVRKTFRKLELPFAVDGSDVEELCIKDIPDIEVRNWRRYDQNQDDEVESVHSDNLNEAINQLI